MCSYCKKQGHWKHDCPKRAINLQHKKREEVRLAELARKCSQLALAGLSKSTHHYWAVPKSSRQTAMYSNAIYTSLYLVLDIGFVGRPPGLM